MNSSNYSFLGRSNQLQLVVEAGHVLDGVGVPEGEDLPHIFESDPIGDVINPSVIKVMSVVLVVPQVDPYAFSSEAYQ